MSNSSSSSRKYNIFQLLGCLILSANMGSAFGQTSMIIDFLEHLDLTNFKYLSPSSIKAVSASIILLGCILGAILSATYFEGKHQQALGICFLPCLLGWLLIMTALQNLANFTNMFHFQDTKFHYRDLKYGVSFVIVARLLLGVASGIILVNTPIFLENYKNETRLECRKNRSVQTNSSTSNLTNFRKKAQIGLSSLFQIGFVIGLFIQHISFMLLDSGSAPPRISDHQNLGYNTSITIIGKSPHLKILPRLSFWMFISTVIAPFCFVKRNFRNKKFKFIRPRKEKNMEQNTNANKHDKDTLGQNRQNSEVTQPLLDRSRSSEVSNSSTPKLPLARAKHAHAPKEKIKIKLSDTPTVVSTDCLDSSFDTTSCVSTEGNLNSTSTTCNSVVKIKPQRSSSISDDLEQRNDKNKESTSPRETTHDASNRYPHLHVKWSDFYKTKHLWSKTSKIIIVTSFQHLVGLNAVNFYIRQMFQQKHGVRNSFLKEHTISKFSSLVAFLQVIFTILGAVVASKSSKRDKRRIDNWMACSQKRGTQSSILRKKKSANSIMQHDYKYLRLTLQISCLGVTISLILLSILYKTNMPFIYILLTVIAYQIFFCLGLGPGTWILTAIIAKSGEDLEIERPDPAIIENDKALESLEFGCQPSDVAAELEFTRFFMSLNEYERIVIGHDFKDFIKGCTFQGQDCLKRK